MCFLSFISLDHVKGSMITSPNSKLTILLLDLLFAASKNGLGHRSFRLRQLASFMNEILGPCPGQALFASAVLSRTKRTQTTQKYFHIVRLNSHFITKPYRPFYTLSNHSGQPVQSTRYHIL